MSFLKKFQNMIADEDAVLTPHVRADLRERHNEMVAVIAKGNLLDDLETQTFAETARVTEVDAQWRDRLATDIDSLNAKRSLLEDEIATRQKKLGETNRAIAALELAHNHLSAKTEWGKTLAADRFKQDGRTATGLPDSDEEVLVSETDRPMRIHLRNAVTEAEERSYPLLDERYEKRNQNKP